jgi:hypothetical protein
LPCCHRQYAQVQATRLWGVPSPNEDIISAPYAIGFRAMLYPKNARGRLSTFPSPRPKSGLVTTARPSKGKQNVIHSLGFDPFDVPRQGNPPEPLNSWWRLSTEDTRMRGRDDQKQTAPEEQDTVRQRQKVILSGSFDLPTACVSRRFVLLSTRSSTEL